MIILFHKEQRIVFDAMLNVHDFLYLLYLYENIIIRFMRALTINE